MFLVALAYMTIASTFTIAKLALQYLQPIFFISIRMLVGGSLLLGYLHFFRRTSISIKKEHFWDFGAIILFHIFFSFVLEFWALQHLSSWKVCLFYSLSPFISAVFSYFWFSEKMTPKKFLGLTIGFFAFLPVIMAAESSEAKLGLFGFLSWPELIMFLSVTSAVYGWTVVRKLGRQGYGMVMINGIGMLGGGLLASIASFLLEGWPVLSSVSGSVTTDIMACVGYMLLLILLANVIFYNLYGFLLKRYTVTFLSFAGFLTPLFAALYGWFFLGEFVGGSFFVTILLVFAGLYIFYQEELRQGYIFPKR